MKNKILYIIIFNILIVSNLVLAEEFIIESGNLNISEKGNLVKSSEGVKIISNNGLSIEGNNSIYNKKKILIEVFGNVKVKDKIKEIEIDADKIIYDKSNDLLTSDGNVKVKDKIKEIEIDADKIIYDKSNDLLTSDGNVKVKDKIKEIEIDADKIIYDKLNNIIGTKGNTKLFIKNKYKINSKDLTFNNKKNLIFSNKKSTLSDHIGNTFSLDAFEFDLIKNQIIAKKIQISDNKNNKYSVESSIINLKNNEILGKDINIEFDNPLFGNKNNNPRLKGRSVISDDEKTTVYKGIFTTCKKRENNKCPPWSLSADVVTHKKKQKLIEYKNAWLEIYDKPVLYFPYFFHPDPTVKRQSGFLFPKFQNSSNSGQSIQIPYYKVLAQNKDLTITPRLFIDNKILLQNEYRQIEKNSNFISDFSFFRDSNKSKGHIFADFNYLNSSYNHNIKIQSVNGDKYLKTEKIKSPLLLDNSYLNSHYSIEKSSNEENLKIEFDVFEDLSRGKSDRYEYVYPSFLFEKKISFDGSNNLKFNSHGFQKKYNTNVYEGVLVNDLEYIANKSILYNGFSAQHKTILRNLNTNSKNSSNYKLDNSNKFFGLFVYDLKFPLIKENQEFKNLLTPILSARYSPTETVNMTNRNIEKLDYNRIYSIDRLANNEFIEGGQSLTLGLEFNKQNKIKDLNTFKLEIAHILRDENNLDLPKINGLNQTRSDIIGNVEISPSKFFDVGYEFSIDNNLKTTNFNLLKTNFKANNFVTSFEFLEENNEIGENSYLSNTTTFNLNQNTNLIFKTSENLDKNITEYYNLIYEYKNDCLTAAIEYDKQYYSDDSLKPEENILFSIKIIPFGNIKTPAITK